MVKQQALIKGIIICSFIFLLGIKFVYALDFYYQIRLGYSNGDLNLIEASVLPLIDEEIENLSGDYTAKIVSFDNATLKNIFFSIPIYDFYYRINGTSKTIIEEKRALSNKTEVTIKLPYYQNAQEISIYDGKFNKKLKVDISYYAKKNVSQPITLLKEGQKIETTTSKNKILEERTNYAAFLIIAVIIIGIALVFLFLKKRGNY